mmetsp:Transcript_3671/g.5977  ORF Transcript_3671/g.5977 Transcript_3671/m.5977 type:complete len:94 (+) Transcript_3671:66-347(+)
MTFQDILFSKPVLYGAIASFTIISSPALTSFVIPTAQRTLGIIIPGVGTWFAAKGLVAMLQAFATQSLICEGVAAGATVATCVAAKETLQNSQ